MPAKEAAGRGSQAAEPITRASKRSARYRAELRRASFGNPVAMCSKSVGYDIAGFLLRPRSACLPSAPAALILVNIATVRARPGALMQIMATARRTRHSGPMPQHREDESR